MKKIVTLLLMALLLTGCGTVEGDTKASDSLTETEKRSTQEGDTFVEENEDVAQEEKQTEYMEVTGTTVTDVPEGMNLYQSISFLYGDEEWQLELYAMAETGENGELLLDDSCEFYMKAVSGEMEYILFHEKVQLGIPKADVFTDMDGTLHVVVKDARTAGYSVSDYVFESTAKTFQGTIFLKYDGINFMGGTS